MVLSKTEMDRFVRHVQGCFVGALVGDVGGLPWETMTAEEILAHTGGRGVMSILDRPNPPRPNPYMPDARPLQSSDDWGLTRATGRGLLACGFDMRRHRAFVATEYVRELERSGPSGYGKGTAESILGMGRYLAGQPDGRNPEVPVPPRPGVGSGNGVGMRVASYGIAAARFNRDLTLPTKWLRNAVIENGQMTHGDVRATIAGYVIARYVESAIQHALWNTPRQTAVDDILSLASAKSMTSFGFPPIPNDSVPRIGRVLECLLLPGALDSPKSLLATVGGNSTLCWESIPYVIGVVMRNPLNVEAAILEAINGGGDTDSNASMVGAIVGAINGIDAFPREWLELIPEVQEALELGQKFAERLAEKSSLPLS